MANCNHDCGSCSASCGERQDPASFKKPAHKESHIKKVIGVVSGKGGVGKSMVTSLLAMARRRNGTVHPQNLRPSRAGSYDRPGCFPHGDPHGYQSYVHQPVAAE